MITHMMAQYSDEWWTARCGIPTCSEFDQIITAAKAELSKSAQKYASRLIAERKCNNPKFFSERFISRSMAAGRETEPRARNWYAMNFDHYQVAQVGFLTTDDGLLGGSPDAVIGLSDDKKSCDGILELKCPEPDTHISYMVDPDSLLMDYRQQVHGHLVVSGCQWVDIVSYCDGYDAVILRTTPNDYTKKLAEALRGFLNLLDSTAAKVRGE